MQFDDRLTISVEEAAKLLGISRGLAYELVARGELPSLRLGRRRVVPIAALHALIANAVTNNSEDSDPPSDAPELPPRRGLRLLTD
ncbi:MAG: excisionase family DNA-binding protein [Actinomycetota bacterium]|nr:excisionase family DNA-binding protein [Actinomycetota bacterium]